MMGNFPQISTVYVVFRTFGGDISTFDTECGPFRPPRLNLTPSATTPLQSRDTAAAPVVMVGRTKRAAVVVARSVEVEVRPRRGEEDDGDEGLRREECILIVYCYPARWMICGWE